MNAARRTLLRAGLTVTAVAALGAGVWASLQFGKRQPRVDDASPLFALTLPGVDGTQTALAQWRGRRLVVNFWATWCAPCVEEMPDLQVLATELRQSDVTVLGLAIDDPAKVRAFAARLAIDYPLLVIGAPGLDLLRSFGHAEASLPFTAVIDREGRIRQRIRGRVEPAALRRELASANA
ncbi:hypothetical protein BH10PSE17_BH10PSE17_28590 [soil metagenome]